MSYPDYHSGEVPALNEIADRLEAQSLASGGGKDETNSTSVALGAGEEFTGEWVTNGGPHIGFNVLSDQPGTLYIEFSTDDGSTITLSKPYAVFGGMANFDALVKGARSHRIRYVNGATAQGQFSLLAFTGEGLFPYAKSDRDEPIYFSEVAQNVTATEYRILVDLSDNVTYPHYDVGRVDIHAGYLQADRDSTGAGAVRMGVITRIDGTSADVAFILGISFEKSADRRIIRDRAFPVPIKLGQSGGVLTKAVSGLTADNITEINTATPLPSAYGTVTPAVGDLVAQFARTGGSYTASVSGFYSGNISPT